MRQQTGAPPEPPGPDLARAFAVQNGLPTLAEAGGDDVEEADEAPASGTVEARGARLQNGAGHCQLCQQFGGEDSIEYSAVCGRHWRVVGGRSGGYAGCSSYRWNLTMRTARAPELACRSPCLALLWQVLQDLQRTQPAAAGQAHARLHRLAQEHQQQQLMAQQQAQLQAQQLHAQQLHAQQLQAMQMQQMQMMGMPPQMVVAMSPPSAVPPAAAPG
ncbi:unnamed protein product, partial [Prorocentrum cordatum]